MPIRRALKTAAGVAIFLFIALPAAGYVAYQSHLVFLEYLVGDVLKIIPRSMGSYIYQNRYDFMRGLTLTTRDLKITPLKTRDLEELKRVAYARLSRDIPYCVEALREGDFKLDTSTENLVGRLGLIAYNILLLDIPTFPDNQYLESFTRSFESLIGERLINVWIYYDGYGDFHSLGELMERLKDSDMPGFRYRRNERFPVQVREDIFHMFRFPQKFSTEIVFDNLDINDTYSETINDIADAFVYIWKTSGMELAHPSYAAPPGTNITRISSRSTVRTTSPSSMTLREKEEKEKAAAKKDEGEAKPGQSSKK